MNYGLHHRYHTRNLGQPGALPDWQYSAGHMPPLYPAYEGGPVARTGTLQTKPPISMLRSPIIAADAAPAICLDESQNSVSCADPNCRYGDCGAPAGVQQVTVGALCLDQSENQIDCSNPNCTYGDCVSATSWWSKSSIITGVPDIAIYGVLAMLLLGGGFATGRRR